LFYLKKWLDSHPEATRIHLASFGWVDPRLVGIECTLPPLGPDILHPAPKAGDESLGPRPGWYAIDVNHLHSTNDAVVDEHGDLRYPTSIEMNYHYFLRFEPVAMAGYSIYIYHITLDEANRVRRELGMEGVRKDEGGRMKDEG
jgi:hypothetical protein